MFHSDTLLLLYYGLDIRNDVILYTTTVLCLNVNSWYIPNDKFKWHLSHNFAQLLRHVFY